MIIAIDFDETLTADGELWRRFIESAKSLGHQVFCVTARRETEENIDTVSDWMTMHGIDIPVFFTGLRSKVDFMRSRGIEVAIYIDDDPKRCFLGH